MVTIAEIKMQYEDFIHPNKEAIAKRDKFLSAYPDIQFNEDGGFTINFDSKLLPSFMFKEKELASMKAQLLIDMPQNCRECCLQVRDQPCEEYAPDYYCCINFEDTSDYQYSEGRPSWCPLKPVEEAKTIFDEVIPPTKYVPNNWSAYSDYAFERGWNACVDAVKERIKKLEIGEVIES